MAAPSCRCFKGLCGARAPAPTACWYGPPAEVKERRTTTFHVRRREWRGMPVIWGVPSPFARDAVTHEVAGTCATASLRDGPAQR
jgi:hypothetical protein